MISIKIFKDFLAGFDTYIHYLFIENIFILAFTVMMFILGAVMRISELLSKQNSVWFVLVVMIFVFIVCLFVTLLIILKFYSFRNTKIWIEIAIGMSYFLFGFLGNIISKISMFTLVMGIGIYSLYQTFKDVKMPKKKSIYWTIRGSNALMIFYFLFYIFIQAIFKFGFEVVKK